MLAKLVKPNGNLQKLIEAVNKKEHVSVFGLNKQASFVVLTQNSESFLFCVAGSEQDAVTIKEIASNAGHETELLLQPLIYEPDEISSACEEQMQQVINKLLAGKLSALVVTAPVLLSKLPSKQFLEESRLHLQVNGKYSITQIRKQLTALGYSYTDRIEKEKEYRGVGDVVDVFIPNTVNPVRLSFFGRELEEIKELDLVTGKTLEKLAEVYIPCCNLKDAKRESGILSYLPPESQIVFYETKQVMDMLTEAAAKKRADLFTVKEALVFPPDAQLLSFGQLIHANNFFKPLKVFNLKTNPLVNYLQHKTAFYNDMKVCYENGYTILLFVKTNELKNYISAELSKWGFLCLETSTLAAAQKGSVNLITKEYNLSACFAEEKLLVIGTDNFLKKQPQAFKPMPVNQDALTEVPVAGNFVVHAVHGIGKCLGVVSLNVSEFYKDYLEIEYKNNDKLYLPVENLDSVTKYVGSEHPKLSKLGGLDFAKIKQNVKRSLRELSVNLKELYKERMEQKGIVFAADDELQQSFEAGFAYTETADQIKAIDEMKRDMQSQKAMDRLICGDVGFGKTEVALRGIFKAVMAGYQVMFLCPTTILSEQHYNTCIARFKEFGVTVAVLNRFKTEAEKKKVLSELLAGKIDIVCGTHSLLGKNVKFKNLGLLVLDEEQKFGVEHKEKIKKLKTNIDVLTLSATPIPRTLNMALTGIKDISVIATPPPERLPVATHAVAYSDALVKNAIAEELARGGQVMIVHNRVQDIYDVANRIKAMCPENTVVDVAHGQMAENILEDAIYKLYNGSTQVLVSTTLIENGVDLPMANTLIVLNADALGLSTLYQLKGRVGRSERQAYAYFTYTKNKPLTEDGYKRLEAISEYSGLGNGLKVALKDLEIRGAGSLFGAEQHGHIEKVGYNLYLELLKESVSESADSVNHVFNDVRIELMEDANLPNYYVSQTTARMSVYANISKLGNRAEAEKLKLELSASYGPVPVAVSNLCDAAVIKNISRKHNIVKVKMKSNGGEIVFAASQDMLKEKITNAVSKSGNSFVINLQTLPTINVKPERNINELKQKIMVFLQLLEQ